MQAKHRSLMICAGSVALALLGVLGFALDMFSFPRGFFARFHLEFAVLALLSTFPAGWCLLKARRQRKAVEARRRNDLAARTLRTFSKLGIVVSRNKADDRRVPAAPVQAGRGELR